MYTLIWLSILLDLATLLWPGFAINSHPTNSGFENKAALVTAWSFGWEEDKADHRQKATSHGNNTIPEKQGVRMGRPRG